MSAAENQPAKSPVSHLHVVNLVVALLAGIISIAGGIYSLKTNLFSGPGYGSVQGIVRDEKIAKPLYLTQVEIAGTDGAVVNTVTTDADGHYLVETLKTGNYEVKFTAPRHAVQTKTVKIERDLKSSINVDLVPEPEPVNTIPAASEVVAPVNPAPVYPVTAAGSQVTPTAQVPAPVYPSSYVQTAEPVPPMPGTGGYRHHPRRYPGGAYGTSDAGTTQSGTSSNQNSALLQAGTQLVQGLFSSKTESDTSSKTS